MFTRESCNIFIHRKYIAVDAPSIVDTFNFVLFSPFLVSVLFLAICFESQRDIPLYGLAL
jgi:hypothetical protein